MVNTSVRNVFMILMLFLLPLGCFADTAEGLKLLKDGDIFGAKAEFSKSAGVGDLEALTQLALWHKNYAISSQDRVQAERLLRIAAKKRHPSACYHLSNLLTSPGLPLSKESEDLLKSAADAGFTDAELEYGLFLAGAPKNRLSAMDVVSYLTRAAEKKNIEAMLNLGFFLQSDAHQEEYKKAYSWFLRAADSGNPQGHFQCGRFNMLGLHAQNDFLAALNHFQKAFVGGNFEAARFIGQIYDSGLVGAPDSQKARAWYLEGAYKKDSGAFGALAGMYEFGDGVPRDPAKAWMFYSLGMQFFSKSVAKETKETFARRKDAIAKELSTIQLSKAREEMKNWFNP